MTDQYDENKSDWKYLRKDMGENQVCWTRVGCRILLLDQNHNAMNSSIAVDQAMRYAQGLWILSACYGFQAVSKEESLKYDYNCYKYPL